MQEAQEILLNYSIAGIVLFVSMRLNWYFIKNNEKMVKSFNATINSFQKNEDAQTELMRDMRKMIGKLMEYIQTKK